MWKCKLNVFFHQVLASWTEDFLWTWCIQWKWGPWSPVLHDCSYGHMLSHSSGYHHPVLPCSLVGYPCCKSSYLQFMLYMRWTKAQQSLTLCWYVNHRSPCSRRNQSQPRKLREKYPEWSLSWLWHIASAGDLTPFLPALLRLILDTPSILWLLPCLHTLPRAPPSTTQLFMSSWTDRWGQQSQSHAHQISLSKSYMCGLHL